MLYAVTVLYLLMISNHESLTKKMYLSTSQLTEVFFQEATAELLLHSLGK